MDILHRILYSMYICNRWPYFWMPPELSKTRKATCYRKSSWERKSATSSQFPCTSPLYVFSKFKSCCKCSSKRIFRAQLLYKLNYYILIKSLKYVLAFYFLYFYNTRWFSRNITLAHNTASFLYLIYVTKYITIIQVASIYKAMNHLNFRNSYDIEFITVCGLE